MGDGQAIARSAREALAPYVIELVGTLLLAYTVATAASPSNGSALAPLAIASILMGQVYAGGATSGAHYNPAVTVAVSLRRALAPWESKLIVHPMVAIMYIVMQLVGAVRAPSGHTSAIFHECTGPNPTDRLCGVDSYGRRAEGSLRASPCL